RIPKATLPEVRVRYRVYAHDLTVRTNHLDDSHGYFNGAAMFVTSDEHRVQPSFLELRLPQGWRAFCSLPSPAQGTYRAQDFDALVDSPVEMGPDLVSFKFTAAGKPHEVVVWGTGNYDRRQIADDLETLCQAEAKLFGSLPCERYIFLVLLTDKGRGGLEHAESCTLLVPRASFRPRKSYEDFLALAAHEYFHLWNVKRIKPKALVPYDYKREVYTTLLWAMEGVTSYYDTLLLRRTGFIDPSRYLTRLGEVITSVESTPGRRELPLSEASRLAWIKHYRPDENTPNSGISYYAKGEIVAALLDLELRRRSGGVRSLDDLMRLLFLRYGDGSGVPEDGVEAAASELAGQDLTPFFDRAIRSTEELDYGVFGSAGLQLRRRAKRGGADRGGTPEDDGGGEKAWLGVDLKAGDRAIVATTFTGSPAAAAGLYPDDEIIAVDGSRATPSSLNERIEEHVPGDSVRVTVFRRDQLVELDVHLTPRPHSACWLEKMPNPTPAQRALYEACLGAPFS
ncbi:MAG: M61 family metallopeptidase, partial [Deltaproteobacteria bacterium]|nr:M61 family metallopeptidase [Deltaproteobacteria bacterium]